MEAAKAETSTQSGGSLTKTLVVSFVMLAAMIAVSALVCFCVNKDQLKRINAQFITEEQKRIGDTQKYAQPGQVGKGYQNKVKKAGIVIVEDYRESEPNEQQNRQAQKGVGDE